MDILRIDQVYQCDLLRVTTYVTARVPKILLYTLTLGKRSKLHHMMHVHFYSKSSEVARPKKTILQGRLNLLSPCDF